MRGGEASEHSPMQLPTQGQWWSKRATQRLQTAQCLERSGRRTRQAEQKRAGSKAPPPASDSCRMVRSLSGREALITPGSARHERRNVSHSAPDDATKPSEAAHGTAPATNTTHVM